MSAMVKGGCGNVSWNTDKAATGLGNRSAPFFCPPEEEPLLPMDVMDVMDMIYRKTIYFLILLLAPITYSVTTNTY